MGLRAFNPDKFISEASPPQSAKQATVSTQFDPDKFIAEASQNAPRQTNQDQGVIMSAIETIGKLADIGTGSRLARSAIGKALGVNQDISAMVAPTGEQIAAKGLGISTDPMISEETLKKQKLPPPVILDLLKNYSPADVAGLGIDIAADPSILIAPVKVIKGALPGAKALAKGILKGGAKATDLVTGTTRVADTLAIAEKAGTEAIEVAKKTFKPDISSKAAKYEEIATKFGIKGGPTAAHQFGKNSFAAKMERKIAETGGPKSDELLGIVDQTQEALDKAIEKIGNGPPMNKVEAGNFLTEAYNTGVQRIFDSIDFTYKNAGQQVPGLQITENASKKLGMKLNGIERKAKGLLERGTRVEKAQAKNMLQSVQSIRKSGVNYKFLREQMQSIGKEAFEKQPLPPNGIPIDTRSMRDLYHTMSDALIETIDTSVSPDIANKIRENNKVMTEFFGQRSKIAPIILNPKLAPEQIFEKAVINANSDQIKAIREILNVEDFERLRGSFLDDLASKTLGGDTPTRTFFNKLEKKGHIVDEMLTPAEKTDIVDLLEFRDEIGPLVLSTSGTGASNQLKSAAKAAVEVASNVAFLEGLKKSAKTSLERQALEKLSTEPIGVIRKTIDKLPISQWGTRRIGIKGAQTYEQTKGSQERKGILGLKK